MNIFKAMAVRCVEEVTRAIPVIDFYNANYFHRERYAAKEADGGWCRVRSRNLRRRRIMAI
jgi:hypothetical protein